MRRDKKPIGRWIGEALLIFLSVFGAFYFDNLREKNNQNEVYIRHLLDLKHDLIENQGKFGWELSAQSNAENGRGYIQANINKYTYFSSLFEQPNRSNADTLMSIVRNGGFFGLSEWIFTSPQYEKLSSEYYSFIKNDSLKSRIQMHFRHNETRQRHKGKINQLVAEFQEIEDQLNLSEDGVLANRNVLFSNRSVNKIRRIKDAYFTLRNFTQTNKTSDSLLIIQVDHELGLWDRLDE